MESNESDEIKSTSADDGAEKQVNDKDSDKITQAAQAQSTEIKQSSPDKISSLCKGSFSSPANFDYKFGAKAAKLPGGPVLRPSLLRPSALSSLANNAASGSESVSQLSESQNHFKLTNVAREQKKGTQEMQSDEKHSTLDGSKKSESDGGAKNDKRDLNESEDGKEKNIPQFLALSNNPKETGDGDSYRSTSIGTSCVSNSSSIAPSTSSAPSFVFGQNLKERVVGTLDLETPESSREGGAVEKSADQNGSPELLFSSAAAVCKNTDKPGLSLTQAAQELEEANRASKRKYSEVALLTGEEDETNVLQINCKLFAFDKSTSSYQERGRGLLRLNDKDDESRLVARAAGTQRLVLNTKVWPGMTAERAGPKSLRLTAQDVQGDLRIFVIQAAQKEVDQLHSLLTQRLKRAQDRQPKKLATDH